MSHAFRQDARSHRAPGLIRDALGGSRRWPAAAAWVLAVGLALAGCAPSPASAARPATPPVTATTHARSLPPSATSGQAAPAAPAIHRRFAYVLAIRDAQPNRQSVVGFLSLSQTGTALRGRFRLFYLLRDATGVFQPQRKSWAVGGSLVAGSRAQLVFRRAGGNPDCVLFPCNVSGRLSASALDLKANTGGSAGAVRLAPGRLSDFEHRVAAIEAYIRGYDEYVTAQRIEAARYRGSGKPSTPSGG